jgi:uncharacterized protein
MAGLPKVVTWQRVDAVGVEQTLLSDASGLHARGTQLSADPIPYTCRYELYTDEAWATVHFEVSVEGSGFLRVVRLERASGRWRVTASEQGDLDAALRAAGQAPTGLPGSESPDELVGALDIDLENSPLTNTLPVRRLALFEGATGAAHDVEMAFVRLPSLEVVHSVQTYSALGGGVVRFRSGGFQATLTMDDDGYVRHYPDLAERV